MSAAALLRDARLSAGLTQAELARRAGTAQSAVARYESGAASPCVRTLERLLAAAGRRLVLEAPPSAGPAADLDSERMRLLRRSRPGILRIARSHGVTNLRVFGSVARGEDRPDSDIDLLVEYDDAAHGALPLMRLRRELAELLGERVDVATLDLLKPEIAAAAAAEAVPL